MDVKNLFPDQKFLPDEDEVKMRNFDGYHPYTLTSGEEATRERRKEQAARRRKLKFKSSLHDFWNITICDGVIGLIDPIQREANERRDLRKTFQEVDEAERKRKLARNKERYRKSVL